MSGKRKLGKGLRFGVLIIVVSLVMWLLPMGSLFGEEKGVPGWCWKVETDPISTWTNTTGIITGIEIHAGLGQIYSGLITSDGTYGHVVEDDATGKVIYLQYYVTDPGTLPGGQTWVAGYVVSGIGTPTVTVTRTGDGPVIHGISWVHFFCESTCTGTVTVVKKVGGETPATDIGTFYFIVKYPNGAEAEYDLTAPNYSRILDPILCGDYQIWENEDKNPPGYVLRIIQTTIGSEENDVVSFTMTGGDSGTVTINNKECKGDLTVVKKVAGETPATDIGAFYFIVKYPDGTEAEYDLTASDYSKTFVGIPCGNYEVWENEDKNPPGYELRIIQTEVGTGGEKASFTLTSDGNTVTINNKVEIYGSIIVNKSFVGGAASSGTFTFNVYEKSANGSPIATGTITINNGVSGFTIITDPDLIAGTTYYVEEISKPGARKLVVALENPTSEDAVSFENEVPEKGCIVVLKTTDDKVAPGTNFVFSISPGGQTITIKTDGTHSGSGKFCGLIIGQKYTIKETTTGYTTTVSLNGSNYKSGTSGVVKVPSGKDGKIWFHNDPGGNGGNGKKDGDGDGIEVLGIQELPFTGFNWIYYVIGMALIIAGGFTSISVTKLLKRKEQ